MGLQEHKKRIHFILVLLMAVSFTLLFCGSSMLVGSFGRDSSVFYTIGRGIVQHKVAYKDLFDHKGLYLYLLNALGVLIADRHTFGLWLIETVFVVVDSFLIFRISRKMSASDGGALISTALTLILASFYWEGGNLTETYGLLPELFTGVLLWDAVGGEEVRPFPACTMFLIGICAGAELFLRANMVMAWIPVAVIVIGTELWERRFRNAGMIILYGMLGVLTASVFPLYYCLKHDCLPEMFFASFVFNLRYVGDGPSLSVFFDHTLRQCLFLLVTGLGACSCVVVWRRAHSGKSRWMFLSSFLFSVISVLLSGRLYRHYNLYLVPFAIPFFAYMSTFVSKRMGKRCVLLLVSLMAVISIWMNSSFARDTVKIIMHYSGTNYTLQEVVASRLEADYPEIRNVLVANGSPWYYARLNVVPEERYFYLPSVDYDVFPYAVDAQAEAILDGRTEAVLLEWTDPKEKTWMPGGKRNEEVTTGLGKNYTEVFNLGDTSLYIRNDIA